MELDFEGKHAERAYPILASLVTPRPIALVTTLSPDGKINAAPFSFFNVLGAEPPIVAFAPGDRDDGTPKAWILTVNAWSAVVPEGGVSSCPGAAGDASEKRAGVRPST